MCQAYGGPPQYGIARQLSMTNSCAAVFGQRCSPQPSNGGYFPRRNLELSFNLLQLSQTHVHLVQHIGVHCMPSREHYSP